MAYCRPMNFASCRWLVALLVYCGVAVLVGGQSTTDDDIDKDEINKLIDIVAELRAQQAKTEGQLARVLAELAKTKNQLATSMDENKS